MHPEYCCQCGRKRKITERQMEAYSAHLGIINVFEHGVEKVGSGHPLRPNEIHPQLLADACIWRNGGTGHGDTHICAICLLAGLRLLKARIDKDVAELEEATR